MAPKLYYYLQSPPVRAVLMTAKALNLELELIHLTTENKKELTKINPQHTVPTLIDEDGFVIWDSHAIMAYLVSKYGKDDSLYPKDLKKRALIDQRLHFEGGVSFPKISSTIRPLIQRQKKSLDQSDLEAIIEIYSYVEAFLDGRQWIAGDSVTIADFSLIASITTITPLAKVDSEKFPLLTDWLKRAEQLSVYSENQKGIEVLENFLKKL